MPENVMAMMSRGYFAGEFVVINDDRAHSIGDCIEVVLKDHAQPTGDTFDVPCLGGGTKTVHVAGFPLTVTLSALTEPIEVLLKLAVGLSFRHWLACLEIGVPSVAIPTHYTKGKLTWHMPKIDGWLPGPFGSKVRAPTTTNRRRHNA
jgi:hypothetical protein